MELDEEVWKDIEGYEGYYQISNYGRVKSLGRNLYSTIDGSFRRYKPESIKTPKNSTDGYNLITLSVNGNNKTIAIHILVANAFVPKPNSNEKLEVNHKDTNRKNNYYKNLEWTTHHENVLHSAKLGHYIREGDKNSNYGNKTLKIFYEEHPEARQLLARKRGQNGRATAISIYNTNDEFIKHFDCMMDCADWMINTYNLKSKAVSMVANISQAAKKNKIYRKHKFKFE